MKAQVHKEENTGEICAHSESDAGSRFQTSLKTSKKRFRKRRSPPLRPACDCMKDISIKICNNIAAGFLAFQLFLEEELSSTLRG